MKHAKHYIHIATMIRKVKEAADRAYQNMIYGGQTNESTFYSTRGKRTVRGKQINRNHGI